MMNDHDYSMSLGEGDVSNEDIGSDSSGQKKKPSKGRQCSSFGCYNYQFVIVNGQRVKTGRKFFSFPTEVNLKNQWCRLIRRVDGEDGFHVRDYTRICDVHFRPEEINRDGKLDRKKNPKPILHSWNGFKVKEPRRELVRHNVVDVDVVDVPPTLEVVEVDNEVVMDDNADDVHFDVGYKVTCSTQTDEGEDDIDQIKAENVQLKAKIASLESDIETLNMEKTALKQTIKQKFMDHVLSSDDECSNYTGFHSVERMKDFYEFLDPGENGENMVMPRSKNKLATGRPRILSPFEGFLLMLCRLRSSFTIRHLSFLFSASTGAVESHFFMWFSFAYLTVARLNWWPSKDSVISNMPKSIKEKYPQTRLIIDCTEFYAENPGKLSLQKMFYSSYKSRVTLKSLVGIMPGGGFTFVSSVFPGSLSDREIVQKSGLLKLPFEVGDVIMADRGFTINDLLEPMGVELVIPAFMEGREQLPVDETVETQQIASERVHVERAIQRLKIYQI